MTMSDDELRQIEEHLETTLARVLTDMTSMAAEAKALQAQLMDVKGRRAALSALPEPGDFRPRPTTPLPPWVHPGNDATEDSSSL